MADHSRNLGIFVKEKQLILRFYFTYFYFEGNPNISIMNLNSIAARTDRELARQSQVHARLSAALYS